MNLYLISQETNNNYDTYDSAVVAHNSAEEAQNTAPSLSMTGKPDFSQTWTAPENVTVELIGVADPKYTEPCVICASFNAG